MPSQNAKFLADITPFTMVDFEGEISSIAWFSGWNMRCVYCFNAEVVLGEGRLDFEDLRAFLASRENLLSGVVLSGGECTISPHFSDVLGLCRDLGFKIKVDTNGSNPLILEQNLDKIDFISLDFKACEAKFHAITNSKFYENFLLTLGILVRSGVNFEVRTTIHSDFLNENDISQMAEILEKNGYRGVYYLQNFFNAKNLGNLKPPKAHFNADLIRSGLKIGLRNFEKN